MSEDYDTGPLSAADAKILATLRARFAEISKDLTPEIEPALTYSPHVRRADLLDDVPAESELA